MIQEEQAESALMGCNGGGSKNLEHTDQRQALALVAMILQDQH
jgi:hypothetical protein